MNDPRSSGHRAGGGQRSAVSLSLTARRGGLLAALLPMTVVAGVVKAGDPPPVVDSIEPAEIIM